MKSRLGITCAFLLLALSGCGGSPSPVGTGGAGLGDVASNRNAVLALPVTTRDFRARGIGDDDVPLLARFPGLECFDVESGRMAVPQRVTATGFASLAGLHLPALKEVLVGQSDLVSDEAVRSIASIPTVKLLVLRECGPFGLAGVRAIAAMPALEWLDLRGCRGVTDACVPDLKNLRHMEPGGLRLTASGISEEGIRELRKALGPGIVDTDLEHWKADR